MSVSPEQQLRAYVEYFRDLGVYELYQRESPRVGMPEQRPDQVGIEPAPVLARVLDDEPARIASLVTQTSVHGHTNYDVSWLAGSSAVYEWQRGFAAELEFTLRQNHVDRVATSSTLFHGGDMHSFLTMFNGYYRFHNETPFTHVRRILLFCIFAARL